MKKFYTLFAIAVVMLFIGQKGFGHCEMPCGIYDDEMRIKMIKESIATIEKAMNQIEELSKAQPVNYNQLVRWINTKEEHATKIEEIASEYFMIQRIKPAEPADKEKYDMYIQQLTLMHQLQIFAMKSKQTIDLDNIQKMKEILEKFEVSYFGHKLDEVVPGH